MNPIRSNFRPVHGGSLVPDYSNANRLAMGIAQQIKTEKIQKAEQEEAAQLTQLLSGQRMGEALNDPVSRGRWLELYNKDPDAAAGLMDVWKAGNQLEIQEAATEAKEAQQVYQTLEGLNSRYDMNKAKEFLRQTIIARDIAGKPTDKLKNLLVSSPDDFDAGIQIGKSLAGGAVTVLEPATPITLADGAELRDPTTGRLIAENEDKAPTAMETRGIEAREGALQLDRDKFDRDKNKLSAAAESQLMKAQDRAVESEQASGQMMSMAQEFERMQPESGIFARAYENMKSVSGDEDAVTSLRKRYLNLRNATAVQNLPPGVASDKDIELVMAGFLSDTSNPKEVASFLRGMSKIEKQNAAYETYKANWLSDNGNTRGMLKAWKKEVEAAAERDPLGLR